MSSSVLEELQQCIKKMQQLFQECMKSQGQRRPTKRNSRRSSQSQKQFTCWSCGEAGHIERNCKKQANRSTPPRCNHHHAESEKLPRQSLVPTGNLKPSVVHGAVWQEVWRTTLVISPLTLGANFPLSDQMFCPSKSRPSSNL